MFKSLFLILFLSCTSSHFSDNSKRASPNILNEIIYEDKNYFNGEEIKLLIYSNLLENIKNGKVYVNFNNEEVSLDKEKNIYNSKDIILYSKNNTLYATLVGSFKKESTLEISSNDKKETFEIKSSKFFIEEIKDVKNWPGLPNLGNTCFFNSLIKLLARSEGINRLANVIEKTKEKVRKNHKSLFIDDFVTLINGIRLGSKSSFCNKEVVSLIINNFINQYIISRFHSKGEMNCSYSILGLLIGKLEECLNELDEEYFNSEKLYNLRNSDKLSKDISEKNLFQKELLSRFKTSVLPFLVLNRDLYPQTAIVQNVNKEGELDITKYLSELYGYCKINDSLLFRISGPKDMKITNLREKVNFGEDKFELEAFITIILNVHIISYIKDENGVWYRHSDISIKEILDINRQREDYVSIVVYKRVK